MNVQEIIQLIEKSKLCGVSEFIIEGIHVKFNSDKIVTSSPVIHQSPSPQLPPFPYTNIEAVNGQFGPMMQCKPIAPSNPVPELTQKQLEEILKPLSPFENMSEKEILFAATPYYDELQEQKKLHQQKLDEELKK